ncbi:MAG: peptidase U32 family protein [Lachnotalea sp.]
MKNNMVIVSGISSMESLVDRVENGAKEVFLGYIDEQWYSEYGYLISPNRRWGREANFSSIIDLKEAINYAHDKAVLISLALNAHKYTDHQLDKILFLLKKVVPLGIDNIIISDFTLIEMIKRKFPDVNIHISTGGVIFNSMSVKFYKSLGVKRIIFERSLSMEEVIDIAKCDQDLEYEVFVNGSRCANIDGLCNFEHSIMSIGKNNFDNYPMCSLKYNFKLHTKKDINSVETERLIERVKERQYFCSYPKACAACYIYDFYHAGINYVKIPARAMVGSENRKIINSETNFISKCIEFIEKASSSTEYKKYIRNMYSEDFGYTCFEYCERCYY